MTVGIAAAMRVRVARENYYEMHVSRNERANEMTIPGFTAEASLAKTMQHYVLASGAAAEAGRVLPQGLFVSPNGDLIYCYNEGGFSGCFTVRRHIAYTLM